GLAGVGYSLLEKIVGRGMIITAIRAGSPLAGSNLQPGDVIWMIAKHRVSSLEDVGKIIRRQPAGQQLEIEALHDGDPVPVNLIVTDELKSKPGSLGISASGHSRRFRVSGFSRQFLTYAEQMQLLALLACGLLLASLKAEHSRRFLTAGCLVIFTLFSLALVLTSSRAVIASFLLTVVIISIIARSRRVALLVVPAAAVIGSLAIWFMLSTRAQSVAQFGDHSTSRRIGYMSAGLRLIPRHPLFGVGMDAYKAHWKEWGFPGDYVTHTHSTPIQLAMDRGLPALGCYMWLVTTMIIVAWRGYRLTSLDESVDTSGLLLGTAGGLVGFSISSLVNYNFGDSEIVLLL